MAPKRGALFFRHLTRSLSRCAVDSYEFAALPSHINHGDLMGLPSIDDDVIAKKTAAAAAAADGSPAKKKLEDELAKLKEDKKNYDAPRRSSRSRTSTSGPPCSPA